MKTCPECTAEIKPTATRCACGWRAGPPAGASGRGDDPDWWRCSDVLHGQRCAQAGAMAHGTHGGGPFYCAAHFGKHSAVPDAFKREAAAPTIARIRDLVSVVPPPPALPNHAAAARQARGPIDVEALEERRALAGGGNV